MKKEDIDKLVEDIRGKLALNITPKIYMANLKRAMFMHIISVYNIVDEADGSVKLCVLDNHQYEDDLRGCQTYLHVRTDGSLYFPGWHEPHRDLEGDVRRFGYTPEDMRETIRFTEQRVKMCKKLTKCIK